jgi:CubicO group peptidase (beta-lactamase class C family)
MKFASIWRSLWAGVMIIWAASAVAVPKEQLYGKGPNTAFEAGWPLRVNPPNRLAALNGEALQALFARKPVWIEPAAEGAGLPKAMVKFGFFHDPADLLQKHPIMAMVLGKDGKLVFERYQFGTTAQSLFDSQSIAKTLTALSIGVAIQQDSSIDLNAKMAEMAPKLKGSPIGDATLRQALQMQCGHAFKWLDDGAEASAGQYAKTRFAAADKGSRDLYQYFKELPANTPGKTFAYDPHCTEALSMLITQKTGLPLRTFFEQTVWKKMGATSKAAWLSPTRNPELTSGPSAFYATLTDYAMLANTMVNGGVSNGQAVIPARWLESMQTDTVAVGKSENENFARYGYQVWVRQDKPDSWFAGLGNYGQRFYLDPKSNSFMVIFALDFDHIKDSDKFWEWFRTTPMDKL